MDFANYIEPKTPAPLKSHWLQVSMNGKVYIPHLYRIRRRWFQAKEIRTLDLKRHGHAHCIYHLIYYLEGANSILIDDQPVAISSGQMVLIEPNVFHNVIPREPTDCSFLTLMFTYQCGEELLSVNFGQLLEQLTGYPIQPPRIIQDGKGALRHLFTTLEKEVMGTAEEDLKRVGYCLAGLFNEILGNSLRSDHLKPVPEDILDVKRYILTNIAQTITIEDLIEVSHLSRSQLIGKFKQYCGISPINYLIEARIDKSKTYLLHSTKRIKEIAWLCGFQSEYHFSKTFKKRVLMTPGQYRQTGPA
ncbi:MAG: AraC family transcriptional regulator [Verrucomicrobiota bacterium JB024]|nr:AraC family transcriptional regulator [Verrucomicrobiota bacterium JB024]